MAPRKQTSAATKVVADRCTGAPEATGGVPDHGWGRVPNWVIPLPPDPAPEPEPLGTAGGATSLSWSKTSGGSRSWRHGVPVGTPI